MEISFLVLIFQGIPEMIAVAAMGFTIARIPLDFKRILLTGCLLGITAYLVRLLPVTFGVHTIALIFLLIFCLFKFGNKNFFSAILSGILAFLVLVIVETIVSMVIFSVFKVSPEQVIQSDLLMIVSGIPQILLIVLVNYLVNKLRKKPWVTQS